ncbi:MAG: response regulator [Prochloraceae cyanobacterium]|nr:response regulator [Prochloraceae cyanobacterium]
MTAKHILIIDDEEDIQEVARLALELVGGWKVSTASSGHEGIIKASAEQPDAILLDVMMPEMDGIATFKKLQADPTTKQIPVILLTAKVQSQDRRQFALLEVTGVISKPFKTMNLADRVSEILHWNE